MGACGEAEFMAHQQLQLKAIMPWSVVEPIAAMVPQCRKFRPARTIAVGTISLAGAAGFEPANAGIKSRCLTTWRRPISEAPI